MTRVRGLETTVPPKFGGGAPQDSGPVRRMSLLEGYDLWARTYDDPNPLHALEERVLGPLLPNLMDKQVLDVACGTGRWLGKLLSWGARAGVGVDLSAEMVARASAKPSLHGRCVRGDCLALPFRPAMADLIICSLAVGHIRDLGTLARELARVARPPADLLVTDFHPHGHARGWRRTFRSGGEILEVPSMAHALERVRAAFKREGFQFVRCEEPYFGEPERHIFVRRGRTHLFQGAYESPAVYIFHFKLLGGRPRKER